MRYEKYINRVNKQSVDYLKKDNLKQRLLYDYNTEIIEYNNKQLSVIIQTEKYSDNDSYYKISSDFETGLKSGSVIDWKRVNRKFMIFSNRITEKSYFIGRMYEAKYEVSYIDEYGNKITQYGVVKSINDTIKDETVDSIPITVAMIDGDLVLYLEKTPTINNLFNREKIIKIGNRNWKIVGWDDLTYDNIVMFNLIEMLKNSNDSEDIPYPELDYKKSIISSNLDNLTDFALNYQLDLKIETYVNDELVKENYDIITKNCTYTNNKILFNNIGTAYVKIIGKESKKEKEYNFNIINEITDDITIKITGRGLIKISVPYTYIITGFINGQEINKADFDLKYKTEFIKDEAIKIKKITASEFFLKTDKIGTYNITINIKDINDMIVCTKEIQIQSEDILA